VFPVVVAISLLLVWRHKENLIRLASGDEKRIGEKAQPAPPTEKPQP
jgi:hypothetical protein